MCWIGCDILNKHALWFQEELVDSIQKKMDKLKEEKKELTKELEETETLGKEVQKRSSISCLLCSKITIKEGILKS